MACLVRGTEGEPDRCEHCGHPGLRRLVSAFNVRGTVPTNDRALRYGSRDFLERPERFFYILIRPNWRSWMVWGAYFLTMQGAIGAAWIAAGWFGLDRVLTLLDTSTGHTHYRGRKTRNERIRCRQTDKTCGWLGSSEAAILL